MAAVPRWATLRQTVLDDARLGTGEAHLESPEVPEWIAESNEHDIAGELSEALSNVEGRKREMMCSMLALLCRQGDDIAQRKAIELLDLFRSVLTDHCIHQAQSFVDRELQ